MHKHARNTHTHTPTLTHMYETAHARTSTCGTVYSAAVRSHRSGGIRIKSVATWEPVEIGELPIF